jgi:hypothetical protein
MPSQIDFGFQLGPCTEWGAFERRLVMSGVMAYLLEPSDEARRAGIRRVLMAGEIAKLESETRSGAQTDQMVVEIKADLAREVKAIATRRSSTTYRRALAFDFDEEKPGRRSGEAIRAILTTGLIVKVMHEAAKGSEKRAVVRRRPGWDAANAKSEAGHETEKGAAAH